ncbi:MAG: D-alanine--D-alanine ligase, partial [Tissierellia bacterium]|nr:D-alanine--D-alanine ligase [Tissierellia bacterium]
MKVGVLFGGRSVEHQVSVITGLQIMENMDKEKYTPVPIFIDNEGKWFTGDCLMNFETYKNNDFSGATQIMINPSKGDFNLYALPENVKLFGKKIIDSVDIMFPALHGTYGEDGKLQGVFEWMGIPYVGCGVLSAAVGMDKIT